MSDSRSRGSRRRRLSGRDMRPGAHRGSGRRRDADSRQRGGGASLTPSGSTIVRPRPPPTCPSTGPPRSSPNWCRAGDQIPPDGTIVTFVATLGSVEPAQAPTAAGRATATFLAGTISGTAVIAARSKQDAVNIEGVAKIAVGTAAAARVLVSANPASVPYNGGSSTITATVVDAAASRSRPFRSRSPRRPAPSLRRRPRPTRTASRRRPSPPVSRRR